MWWKQSRHSSRADEFENRVIPRAAGLALILYGGISLGLIVALASAHTAAAPSVCTPRLDAAAAANPYAADVPAGADARSSRLAAASDSTSPLGFGFLVFDWDPAAGIPGFGPLTTTPRSFASRAE
jgi:hypothetical protein